MLLCCVVLCYVKHMILGFLLSAFLISLLNLSTSKNAKNQNSRKSQFFFFSKIVKSKWCYEKVLLKRFHLNGHTIGFRPQTQKLELHYMFP